MESIHGKRPLFVSVPYTRTPYERGDPINSFMSWIGGKKALRDEIVARFPPKFERYIEVFGGAGWVLFHKQPNDMEVFNDLNGSLVNLYRCVREQPEKLKEELRYLLNSRLDFKYMKQMLHAQANIPDVRRAAYYYALIRYSYSSATRKRRIMMTRLQDEVSRVLSMYDYMTWYDKENACLSIEYRDIELLALNDDGTIYYNQHNIQTEQRRNRQKKVSNLIYKINEYIKPYEEAEQGKNSYRILATYNGIVMAAKESDKYGYEFITWEGSPNDIWNRFDVQTSPNYDYIKELFATRSGLISKNRVFSRKQLEDLHKSLFFTIENDMDLPFKEKWRLEKLMYKIAYTLPEIPNEESPNNFFEQSM